MKHLKLLLCTLCATMILGGCAYFDTGETIETGENQETVRFDLINGGQQTEQELTNYSTAVKTSTKGRVQVFTLEGEEEESPVPGKPLNTHEPGGKYVDPSVQVFPMDGAFNEIDPAYFNRMPFDEAEAEPVEIASLAPFAEEKQSEIEVIDLPEVSEEPVEVAAPDTHTQPSAPDVFAEAVSDVAKVYFGHDSTQLDTEGRDRIAEVTRDFDPGERRGLSVEGHASVRANYQDSIQRKMVNLKISMDRALSVARALVEGGVPADAIRTVAWGDTRPSGPMDGKDAEAAARRVDIISQ